MRTDPPRRFVQDSVRAEWGKTWSVVVPAAWVVATVLIAAATGSSLANDVVISVASGEVPRGSTTPVVDVVAPSLQFSQVAIGAFAIHMVTPEYTTGSIVPTVLAQPRRWPVVAAKAAVATGTAAVLGVLLGPLLVLGARAILGAHAGAAGAVWGVALAAAAVFAAAAALGVGLGFLTRSAVGALCAVFFLLVVTLAAPEGIAWCLPGPAGADLVERLAAGSWPVRSLLVLAVWALVGVAAATWSVRRRDV